MHNGTILNRIHGTIYFFELACGLKHEDTINKPLIIRQHEKLRGLLTMLKENRKPLTTAHKERLGSFERRVHKCYRLLGIIKEAK